MKKIFIVIGLVIFAGMVILTGGDNTHNKASNEGTQDNVETLQAADDIYDTPEYEEKYYYKGKEISKEQYEAYQVQIQAIKAQVQILKAAADEYDRSTPNITYRRYSDGRVETRIDP